MKKSPDYKKIADPSKHSAAYIRCLVAKPENRKHFNDNSMLRILSILKLKELADQATMGISAEKKTYSTFCAVDPKNPAVYFTPERREAFLNAIKAGGKEWKADSTFTIRNRQEIDRVMERIEHAHQRMHALAARNININNLPDEMKSQYTQDMALLVMADPARSKDFAFGMMHGAIVDIVHGIATPSFQKFLEQKAQGPNALTTAGILEQVDHHDPEDGKSFRTLFHEFEAYKKQHPEVENAHAQNVAPENQIAAPQEEPEMEENPADQSGMADADQEDLQGDEPSFMS